MNRRSILTTKILPTSRSGPMYHNFSVEIDHWIQIIFKDKLTKAALKFLPRLQGSWGQHGAHLGTTGPRWAPCWLHEPCYLGMNHKHFPLTINMMHISKFRHILFYFCQVRKKRKKMQILSHFEIDYFISCFDMIFIWLAYKVPHSKSINFCHLKPRYFRLKSLAWLLVPWLLVLSSHQ